MCTFSGFGHYVPSVRVLARDLARTTTGALSHTAHRLADEITTVAA
ncbi:hypothetical protein [Streptomyces sp. CBMA152]|nr:hypothetical protein [Streptomyces sp. CBMA152]